MNGLAPKPKPIAASHGQALSHDAMPAPRLVASEASGQASRPAEPISAEKAQGLLALGIFLLILWLIFGRGFVALIDQLAMAAVR